MSPIEASIIGQILSVGVQNKLQFRVFDGEEFASYDPTDDIPTLTEAIGLTDETTLHVFKPNHAGHPQYIGGIFLVHGNEEDVLTDLTAANDLDLGYLESLFSNIRPVSMLELRKAEMRRKMEEKRQNEDEAEAEGRLWFAVAAYKPESTFIIVRKGRPEGDWNEVFQSQHEGAFMFLDPAPLIGKVSEVRAEAIRQFAGSNPGDVMVRMIP